MTDIAVGETDSHFSVDVIKPMVKVREGIWELQKIVGCQPWLSEYQSLSAQSPFDMAILRIVSPTRMTLISSQSFWLYRRIVLQLGLSHYISLGV